MKFMNWTCDFRMKCDTDFVYDLTCTCHGKVAFRAARSFSQGRLSCCAKFLSRARCCEGSSLG